MGAQATEPWCARVMQEVVQRRVQDRGEKRPTKPHDEDLKSRVKRRTEREENDNDQTANLSRRPNFIVEVLSSSCSEDEGPPPLGEPDPDSDDVDEDEKKILTATTSLSKLFGKTFSATPRSTPTRRCQATEAGPRPSRQGCGQRLGGTERASAKATTATTSRRITFLKRPMTTTMT